MTTTTITFLGKNYGQANIPNAAQQPIIIGGLSGPALVTLHNLVSSNLGQGAVKRFSSLDKAINRTWAKLVEYQATVDAEAGQHDDLQDDVEMAGYEAKAGAIEVNPSGTAIVHTGEPGSFKLVLSEEDKTLIADEAAARKPAELPKSEQLIAAAAAARTAPTPGGRSNIWRRPKHENPSKIAYRPEDGTVQAGLYALLTQPGGITMDAYCAAAQALKTKDRTLFTPPAVWGALRYLFVTTRGYGLDFDGTVLKLLVPNDERQSSRKLKREG